ncbi:MAG: DUF839 domain-containing protein [Burkholderiales bacterium]|nr:DUF839 domain-containing protein [Burkholderiales bacterium]
MRSSTPPSLRCERHVIRLAEDGSDGAAKTFKWDVYLFGARSTASADVNLSQLGLDNDFSSPDGLWFSVATPGIAESSDDGGLVGFCSTALRRSPAGSA